MAGSEGCAPDPVITTLLASTVGCCLGLDTRRDERLPGMISLLVEAGLLKMPGGVVALALISLWGHRAPRRPMRTLGGIGGGGLLLYSNALLVQHGLMTASVVRWQLWFWDPFWLLGGILFPVAARAYDASDMGR